MSYYQQVFEKTVQYALAFLDELDTSPVHATDSLGQLRQRLVRPLNEESMEAVEVIDDLVRDTAGGIIGCAGGRFFGWVVGGGLPAAVAADWLTSVWDQNVALYASGPAAAVLEEVSGAWLKDLFGLPPSASFALTTGCQLAHVVCLAAARNALLSALDWDVEAEGLTGAPPIHILSGDQRHGSIERALRLLGLGTRHVQDLPVDEHGCLQRETLARALDTGPDHPTLILLQAGDLNTGAYDPFADLIPLAHEYQAWVHVDGAFGLWAATSPRYRHLTRGIEMADSWATDGHKWLNVPYDCGYAFVRDREAHRSAMSHRASYLLHDDMAREPMDWNLEWSRRGRGIATYAAMRQLGRQGIADLVARTCLYARMLVHQIGSLPGAEVVASPQINQGLVRFLSPSPKAMAGDHDRFTDQVIAEIVRTGEAYFSGTTWRGMRCMRVSVCSWQTNEEDVNRAIAAAERAIDSARAQI